MIYSGRKGGEKSTQEPRKGRDSGQDGEEKQQLLSELYGVGISTISNT